MGMPLPVVVVSRPPEYSASYSVDKLFDTTPGTYWCSPASPVWPQVFVLQLHSPALIEAVNIDAAVPGYDTSAPRMVNIEVAPAQNPGMFMLAAQGMCHRGGTTMIALQQPVLATGLRISCLDNHGGNYCAIATLQVIGTPYGMQAMPGMMPGMQAMPGMMPGMQAMPGMMPGMQAMPGMMPGQMPGMQAVPGMLPGQMPGMQAMPGMMPGMMPGQMPGMMPGQMPGMMGGMVAGQAFAMGQRVQAKWRGGGYWSATIRGFDGARYEVAWDDGSAPEWVPAADVKLA